MLMEPNCILLGNTSVNDSFTVRVCDKNNINGNEVLFDQLKISGLKYLIYNEIKKYINNDYNDLNLWKADIAFSENLKDLTEEQICKNSEQLVPIIHFKKYFPNQDAVDKSLIFVQVPVTDTPNKRIKLEDLSNMQGINLGLIQQRTAEYLEGLLCPFNEPVSCDNIKRYFDAPLLKKLPAHIVYCNQYPAMLDHKASILLPDVTTAVDISMELFKDKINQEMETSYMIDHIIRKMVKITEDYVSDSGLEWVRNNKMNAYTTTTNKLVRPDVLVYCKNVLVMMGEEKAANSTFQTAAEELDGYFSFWNTLAFGNLPLVISFAAVGSRIQFYYYHVVESSNKPRRELIGNVLSLGTGVGLNNLNALRHTINIIRIIRTFDQCGVIQTPMFKLFKEIHRNNATITIFPEKVRKIIERKSIVDEELHRSIHTILLPNFDHYENVKYHTTKNTIHLTYGPVGFLNIPKSENELRYAIADVLEIVSKLHDDDVVHRDIRWENIVKLTDGKWLLIDFEEAANIGEERDKLRIAAPEYEDFDLCQKSGDIWMIGKLMNDHRITFPLSERAREFRNRLLSEDPDRRPTANDALNDDWFEGMEIR
ncbi:hypothetical protein RclHR1_07610008 [Rhizophagus clarus]|nr:hypothetical protein RclHR1_07610008 [Rhizophagus clarus]